MPRASAEGWQFNQVVVGDAFDGLSGFAPGAEPAGDYVDFKSQLDQLLRHTGAGGFALSSAVEINLLILGEVLDLFDEVVGLDADGAGDAFGVGVVVAVAADVCDDQGLRGIGGQPLRQFFGGNARDHVEQTIFAIDPDAINGVDNDADSDDNFDGEPSRAESACDGAESVAEEV